MGDRLVPALLRPRCMCCNDGTQEAQEEEGSTKASTSASTSSRTCARGHYGLSIDAIANHFGRHPFILHGGNSSIHANNNSICSSSHLCNASNNIICSSSHLC